ncbi:MAG: Hsp20/alpha crystallin family protein [candidate division Zixibacteria bacterium]|nr:Hsp20/alpha crystallin family protein [candidate division Zixibacteria bacterium]
MTYLVGPNRIAREIDRVFNGFLDDSYRVSSNGEGFTPRVSIQDTENEIALTFEIPGIEKGDIKVTVIDRALTVSGERKVETMNDNTGLVRNEISYGSFSRSFTLPDTVETEKILADYKNGFLKLTIPKKEEVKPKEIEIKVE